MGWKYGTSISDNIIIFQENQDVFVSKYMEKRTKLL